MYVCCIGKHKGTKQGHKIHNRPHQRNYFSRSAKCNFPADDIPSYIAKPTQMQSAPVFSNMDNPSERRGHEFYNRIWPRNGINCTIPGNHSSKQSI